MAKGVQIASVFTAIGFKVNKKDLDRLQKQLGQLKKDLRQFRNLARINISTNTQSLQTARRELVGINSELAKIKSRVINVKVNQTTTGGGIGGGRGGGRFLGGAVAGGAIGSQLGQFSKGVGGLGFGAFAGADVFKTVNAIDAIKRSLDAASPTLTASASNFQFLKDTTKELGVNFIDSGAAFTKLLAAGQSIDFGQQNTRDLFIATASAARVLNLSADQTNGTLKAMSDILNKSTVTSEELKQQLGDRLPGAIGLMTKAMGDLTGDANFTTKQLFKMMELGQVIAKDVMPLFAKRLLESAKANGALGRAIKSPLANFERMVNEFDEFKELIGRSVFIQTLSDIFVKLGAALDGASGLASGLGIVMATVVAVFESALDILSVIPNFLLIIGAVAAAAFSPFLVWSTIIGGILLIVSDLIAAFEGRESLFGQFFGVDEMKAIGDFLSDTWDMFRRFSTITIGGLVDDLKAIAGFFGKVFEFFIGDDLPEGEPAAPREPAKRFPFQRVTREVPDFGEGGNTIQSVEVKLDVEITEDLPKVELKNVQT